MTEIIHGTDGEPWAKRNERQQKAVVDRVDLFTTVLVRDAVIAIAAHSFPTVEVTIANTQVKPEELVLKLKAPASRENIEKLLMEGTAQALLVKTDLARFTELSPFRGIMKDQPPLPLDGPTAEQLGEPEEEDPLRSAVDRVLAKDAAALAELDDAEGEYPSEGEPFNPDGAEGELVQDQAEAEELGEARAGFMASLASLPDLAPVAEAPPIVVDPPAVSKPKRVRIRARKSAEVV